MTPTAYMTVEAWEQLTPSMIKGIRSLPIVAANPQWWVLEVLDGFGPHTSSHYAMNARADNKIMVLKEEGDSSHVNQGYDKFVAKSDKKNKRKGLAMLRGMEFTGVNNSKIIDQWGLLQVGLYAVRGTDEETWTSSFRAVNMDPRTRVSFPDWCKRIEGHLQTGCQFKTEKSSFDPYSLLPPFWHGMLPEEKKKVVAIIDEYDGEYSVDCCERLHREMSVRYKDLQNLRVCYDMAKENPSHLERGAPSAAAIEDAQVIPELEAAEAAKPSLTKGLDTYQLIPKGKKMTADEKFEHMVAFRKRDPRIKNEDAVEPSSFLDVAVSGTQRELLRLTPQDMTMRNIMRDAGGSGADQKLAKRKLDMHGNVKSHSGVQNDEKRLKSLKNELQLADSIAEIHRREKADKAKKKHEEKQEHLQLAPKARDKLQEKGGDVSKLTKKEISSILFAFYSVDKPATSSTKKQDLVQALQTAIQESGSPMERQSVASQGVLSDPMDDNSDDGDSVVELPPPGQNQQFDEGQ